MSIGYRDTRSTQPIPAQRTVHLSSCVTPGKGVRIPAQRVRPTVTSMLLGDGQLSHLDEDRRGAWRRHGDRARHATRAGRLQISERDDYTLGGQNNPPAWKAALQIAVVLALLTVILWGALSAAGFGWPA